VSSKKKGGDLLRAFKIKAFSLLVCFIVCVLLAGPAFGWPWLTCDPQVGVTHYEVTVGDGTPIVQVALNTRLWFDLEKFLVGDYHVEVKAMRIRNTEWGVSDAAPFDGKCVQIIPVSGLSVVNQ